MTSTRNIQKITKAMKMVASSKLKAVESQLLAARPAAACMDGWFDANVINAEEEVNKEAILAITTDKGLCGAINSSIIKTVRLEMDEYRNAGNECALAVIGEKGRGALSRDQGDSLYLCAGDFGKRPMTFLQASLVAEEVLGGAEWDRLTILYNKYVSMISYDQTKMTTYSREKLFNKMEDLGSAWEFEGDEATILQDLAEFRLGFGIYSAALENATSEQSARMSAMESSSKNAGELLGRLTIQYNRARQAKITTELIEIISGAESLKSGSD
jgi:F-type H+-transporting ATPase subunit gamma